MKLLDETSSSHRHPQCALGPHTPGMSATSQSEIAALCDERGINLGTRNYRGLMVRLALWEFGVANEADPLFTTLPT